MKTRHTLYILLILLVCSVVGYAQTPLDYKCEFNSLSGWTPSTQSNGIWHIGTGQDGAKYVHETTTFVCNQLDRSDSYLYIDNDDIADNVTVVQNGLKDAYLSQTFSFSGVNMPILSFDYYYYFEKKEYNFQDPIIRVEVDLNGDGTNYQFVFPTGENPLQQVDSWQHANVCLTKVANHIQCDVRIHVLSAAAGNFKIAFDNFEIKSFSKDGLPSITITTCAGYIDGAIEVKVKGGGPNYDYLIGNSNNWVTNVNDCKYKFENLTNMSYLVKVRDSQTKCMIEIPSITVEPDNPEIIFSAIPSHIECYGKKDGSITINGDDGCTYSFDNGVSFSSETQYNELSGGTYAIMAKKDGCVSKPLEVTIGADVWMKFNKVEHTNVKNCYGESDGTITIDAEVANGPIDYRFNNTEQDLWYTDIEIKEGLPAGVYQVSIRDANQCVLDYSTTVTITQPPQLKLNDNPIVTNVTGCFGDANGKIVVSAVGGTPGTEGYVYSKDNLNYYPPNVFENLPAGNYTPSVRDSKGCKAFGSQITITQPPKLVISTKSADVGTCHGDQTGVIEFTVQGGTSPYWYSILPERNDYQNGSSFAVGVGVYFPKVLDNNQCPAESDMVKIKEPDQLEIAYSYSSDQLIKCNGDKKGMIGMLAQGGILPYTYTVDNFSSNNITMNNKNECLFENLAAKTYVVQVKDANGCLSNTEEKVINEPEKLTMQVVSTSSSTCHNAADAKVELQAEGGTPKYSYAYSRHGQEVFKTKADNVILLLADEWDFKIIDNNNCETPIQTVKLIDPEPLVIVPVVTNIKNCYGDTDGSIEVKVTGGAEPYWYSINGQSLNDASVFSNLAAGSYNLMVKDNNECKQYYDRVSVTQPNKLAIDNFYYTSIEGCKGANNGLISFMAEGGTGNLLFSKDGVNFVAPTGAGFIEFTGLAAGKYTPMVKDSKGCITKTGEVELTEPDKLEITEIKTSDASCFGYYDGSAEVTVVGGKQVQVKYPYHFFYDGEDDPVCYDGKFNDLSAGSYSFRVTDAYNCTITGSFVISQPTEMKFVRKDSTNVTTCYGDRTGTATLQVSGGVAPITYTATGYNFSEENQTGVFTGMPSSTYEYIATDANGCSVFETASITQPEKLTYSAKITNKIDCYGDDDAAFAVSAFGGTAPYKYSFDNGKTFPYTESSYANVKPGTYYVKAMDAKGCTQQYSYQIDIVNPAKLEAEYDAYDVICHAGNTGKIIATASGGTKPYRFSIDEKEWKYSTGVFPNLTDSTYSVTVVDVNGCMVKLTDIKLNRPPNVAGFTLSQYEGCSPLQVTMTQDNKDGLTTYTISNGDKLFDCSGPTNYSFINRSGKPQTYTISASMMQLSGAGCTDTASVKVKVLPQPVSDVHLLADTVLYPETTANFANLTQNITSAHWDFGDGTYSDNINEPSHTYEHCGNYNIVLIQNDGQCYDTLVQPFVIEGRPVLAAMKANKDQGCQPITVEFANSSINSDSCVWDFGDGTTSKSSKLSHTFEGAGDYIVSLTAYGDCGAAATTTKTIHVFPKPSAGFFQNADTLYEGQVLRLECESSGCDYYFWDFGDGNSSEDKHPIHPYEFDGTFTISLVVTSSNSCTDTAKVKDAVTVIKNPIVVFPNAFSPDGDGVNDVFLPIHGDVASYKLTIFNKQGQIMYRGTDINEGWDGTRNGHPCPTGVYVYKANIVLRDRSFYDLKGYIVLLKLPVKK